MFAIFVLSLFLFVLSVELVVLRIQGRNHPAFEFSLSQYDVSMFVENNFTNLPEILFSKGHTWFRKNNDGLIEIGINKFGTTALGELSILKCAESSEELKRGGMILEDCYRNKIIKFLLPVNGIVKSVNTNIVGNKISNPYEVLGIQSILKDSPTNRDQLLLTKNPKTCLVKEYN